MVRKREQEESGTIEQHLDMNETGSLRGDEILHHHGKPSREFSEDPVPIDQAMDRFVSDMSEIDREGDEMSGDDHSSGLQGGEPELRRQPHIDSGMPGDVTEEESIREGERIRRIDREAS